MQRVAVDRASTMAVAFLSVQPPNDGKDLSSKNPSVRLHIGHVVHVVHVVHIGQDF